ncbi:MAG: ATP-binding protein [Mycoplasmataceae bacterium]|nr:ATP-binding protein [Mycoplasmataceae bacterium]
MINLLKELINKNEIVKKTLQDCSDEFLLKNKTIIFTALDDENIKEGYNVKIIIVNGHLEWEYNPIKENTKEYELITSIKNMYRYKLPEDWSKYYLLNPNDIDWTEDKRQLAIEFKRMIESIEKKQKVKGIWVLGVSNSGKTFATISLLNYFAKKNKTVSFVSVPELVTTTQKSIGNFNLSTMDYVDKIKKSDIIVIDDLGSERPTPWFKENILLPIIDYRMKANKLTIFNSNLTIGKYANKLKYRSQNPEVEEDTNNKLISRINGLIAREIRIG